MNLLLVIVGMGLITFTLRLAFILGANRIPMPAPVQRSLKYAAPSVLSAIILPELAAQGGTIDLSLGNVRLLAGIVAAFVAWRTKNVLLTIAAGMILLWLIKWLAAL
ncbi:MAG TPA: AzlD domain-containing protein [Candidatus Binatia bacterium]|nr:AzlD domain-containing protein [Candidatus Binatia bacterium]